MRDRTTLIGMRKFGPFLRENEKRREHRIPLTEQMLAILEVMKPISGYRDFVFPSDRDPKKPCNSQTANMALKRMGFAGRLVSHGLRSLASTTLNEHELRNKADILFSTTFSKSKSLFTYHLKTTQTVISLPRQPILFFAQYFV